MDYDMKFYKVKLQLTGLQWIFLEVVEKLFETQDLFRFWCSYKNHCEYAILNYK